MDVWMRCGGVEEKEIQCEERPSSASKGHCGKLSWNVWKGKQPQIQGDNAWTGSWCRCGGVVQADGEGRQRTRALGNTCQRVKKRE